MKGIYVLIIVITADVKLKIGALGPVSFEKGLYAYVGSAQTSLEKRIGRHLRKVKKRFWHIDHLLNHPSTRVARVFVREAGKAEECRLADRLCREGSPIQGFGSSDCSCRSHLFKIRGYEFLEDHMRERVVGPV